MTHNKPEVQAILVTCIDRDGKTILMRAVKLKENHDPSCINSLYQYEPLIRLSDYEALQVECGKLRERVAELKRLCDRLQHCALGFYMDQGDHSHMEAIMQDYHAIMWGDDIDAYRKGEEP